MDARRWLEINKVGSNGREAIPLRDLEMLLEHVFACSRMELYLEELVIDERQKIILSKNLEERKKGRPIQYIIGEVEFADLTLKVDERALIPRPETEWIVERILEIENDTRLQVLDVGSGTGCISLALKNRRPSWDVSGVDVSMPAIELARSNAASTGLSVSFYEGDLSEELEGSEAPLENLDILVSNPPYIPIREKPELQIEVEAFEPHTALFSGSDPQYYYGHLAQLATQALQLGGRVYLECHEDFAKDTAELFSRMGFSDVILENDLNQKPRLMRGLWKN